jgi:serine protease Do
MRRNSLLFLGGVLILAGIGIGVLATARFNLCPLAQSEAAKTENAPAIAMTGFEEAVEKVAGSVGKAVVSISAERVTKVGGGRRFYFNQPFGNSPFGQDESFRKFFDDFFGEVPQQEFKQMGLGSGVIINAQGYILTNEHVVGGADKISVTLSDGRTLSAELKGRDARSDLAVIKINAQGLPMASLGDSDSLKIGQWVVAVGNPFGFALQNPEPTVTAGVISALHRTLGRTLSADRDYNDLIQTDAAINPGNSGGPLVNLKGEIVGINVAIFSTTGGYQGVGFAIPVNNAKRIIKQLMEGKKIAYGWLGVTVQDLSDDLAKYFGLSDKKGVLVAKVLDGGPAQKAGIKDGDIIKEIGAQPVNNVKELLNVVGKSEVGQPLKIKVIRDKKELALSVTIGERPESIGEKSAQAGGPAEGWRGIEVKPDEKQGVVIAEIKPDSPADAAGLNPGDVIAEINKQPVKSIEDYQKITKDLKGDALVRTDKGYFVVKEK